MAAKKSADLTVVESGPQQAVTTQESNVFSAIERIMTDPNASVERANQAFEFYQKVDADKARKAFNNAIAEARKNIPAIVKGQHVKYEHNGKTTEYDHENLADISAVVDPILAEWGLSYRFRTTSNPNEPIRCTCILSHRDGHQEENTLSAGADTSGGKNSIQAVGSTLQYLMRYSLKASLGLSVKKKDDDGQGASAETALLDAEQIKAINDLLEVTLTEEENFLAWVTARLKYPSKIEEIRAKDFDEVHDKLKAKRDQMKGAGK